MYKIRKNTILALTNAVNYYLSHKDNCSIKEACRKFKTSESSVYQGIKCGYLKKITAGNYILSGIDKFEPYHAKEIIKSYYKEYHGKDGKNKQSYIKPENHHNRGQLNLIIPDPPNGFEKYSITELLAEIKRRGGGGDITFTYKI